MPTRKWKVAGSYLLYNELYYNGLMTDWGSEGRARAMCDEMAVRFHSNSSLLHRDFSSRACDARAFPGILHFLLSQPSHLASRSHSFQIGIISLTFQKKRRRFLEKRWSFSKKRRRFFHISRTFFLCWSYSFWKTLLSFLSIFRAFFHRFSSVFLEKRDSHPKNSP